MPSLCIRRSVQLRGDQTPPQAAQRGTRNAIFSLTDTKVTPHTKACTAWKRTTRPPRRRHESHVPCKIERACGSSEIRSESLGEKVNGLRSIFSPTLERTSKSLQTSLSGTSAGDGLENRFARRMCAFSWRRPIWSSARLRHAAGLLAHQYTRRESVAMWTRHCL